MKVDFRRLTWENYPSTETPINADNLNRLEEGVAGLYSDVAEIEQELGGGVGEYVTEWLDEHVDPTGSAVVVDNTLSITGAAADAKKTGDEISDLKDGFDDLDDRVTALEQGSGSGLTDDIKQALLQIAEKVAYIDEDGQDYYDALESALYPPAELVSISCVYTQSGTVYETDTLNSLKDDLVVTAHMSDSTTRTVTTYTLSGTLTEGTSTITVSYSGKTTTFNVTVSAQATYVTDGLIHQYDGINNTGSGHDSTATSWKDLIGSLDFTTISNVTWADDGIVFTGQNSQNVKTASDLSSQSEQTIEMVIAPSATGTQMVGSFNKKDGTESIRFVLYSDNTVGFLGTPGHTYTNSESVVTDVMTMSATYSGYSVTGAYVNNTALSVSNKSHSFKRSNNYLVIGNVEDSDNTKYPFTGKIMALRIYDRQLSVSELAQNHNADIARFGLGA